MGAADAPLPASAGDALGRPQSHQGCFGVAERWGHTCGCVLRSPGARGLHGSRGLRFGSRPRLQSRDLGSGPCAPSPCGDDERVPLPGSPHRGTMPGLYALSSWEALPLKSSRVKACANGYALSIAAHLVYTNPREEPVEGKRGCRNPKNPRAGEHPVPSPFTTQGHPACPAARMSFWGLCLGAVSHPQVSSSTRWRSRRWWPASRRRRAAGGSPSRCRAGTGRRTAASSAAPAPGGRAAVPPVSTTVPLFAWQGGGTTGWRAPARPSRCLGGFWDWRSRRPLSGRVAELLLFLTAPPLPRSPRPGRRRRALHLRHQHGLAGPGREPGRDAAHGAGAAHAAGGGPAPRPPPGPRAARRRRPRA